MSGSKKALVWTGRALASPLLANRRQGGRAPFKIAIRILLPPLAPICEVERLGKFNLTQ